MFISLQLSHIQLFHQGLKTGAAHSRKEIRIQNYQCMKFVSYMGIGSMNGQNSKIAFIAEKRKTSIQPI